MSLVKPAIAAESLGITQVNICVSKKYQPYYIKSSNGKQNAWFDLDAYQRHERNRLFKMSRATLLIAWLVDQTPLTYSDIANTSGVNRSHVTKHNISYNAAMKIFNSTDLNHISEFNKFYGFRQETYRSEDVNM